ncbi:sensor domain-containing diguanylate cyclase [Alkalicoccobacillus plakortidis]|uniref:Sensor domain-containing diguanylate cyclase n=1 Tax=Alkalicoccobacillus plakortidis TaxID=444060 RepID=A0ABT0XFC4_9BACI|nr:sensor domain-containing diguanylate cyclase [Alkalicoccobacillus plakortidis]MCM2674598.1 sensor domain-containing diguanylate cyclase [Alkalicoccobacillus plakortidis]
MRLYDEVGGTEAFWRLIGIHMLCLFTSLWFISTYQFKRYRNTCFYQSRFSSYILYGFVGFYLLIGMLGSINSEGLSGNVDSYIVIMMGIATLFVLHPLYLGMIIVPIQSLFILLLYHTNVSDSAILIKVINTTAAMGISILIAFIYYFYRKNTFLKEKDLQQSEESFRSLFEVNPYPLLMLRAEDKRVLLMNQKAHRFFEEDHRSSYTIHTIFSVNDEMTIFLSRVKEEGSCKDYIFVEQLMNGHKRWLLMNGEVVSFHNETCFMIGFSDISIMKESEQDLIQHASKDGLTGCLNRRSGMVYLQTILENAAHAGVVICFLDVNNLKYVNDQFGHADGDLLIQTIAYVIELNKSPEDLFFRYGGDEFVLVFTNCKLEQGKEKWSDMQAEIEQINQTVDFSFSVSVSCGFSFFEKGMHDTIDELIHRADQSMYSNKKREKPFRVKA